ncbi:MAG: tRNA lysidine(34) synthetase TilS [Verrucomicrobiota bacterium]|nr:MAG: tRNA lysidine(34) synthetase TilS [Verrucomicrobiota bacterium]
MPGNSWQQERLCLACSGGADSVLLVLIFAGTLPPKQLAILHYNHNTRDRETDADADFVQQLAEALQISFFAEKRTSGIQTEDTLRRDRYAFFAKTLKKIGSHYLLTAHHANDLVETMLMRLIRGSSEIAAPKNCQKFGDHFRVHPLLGIRKQEILDFLTKNKIPWREDPSNHSLNYLRNRIRQLLTNFDSAAQRTHWESGFVLAHRYLEEDSACLDALAQSCVQNGTQLDLREVPYPALARRAIHLWLRQPISRTCFEKILTHLDSKIPFRITLNPHFELVIQNRIITKKIFRLSVPYKFTNWTTGTLYLPTGYRLIRSNSTREQIFTESQLNRTCVFLDPQYCSHITVRTWLPGDRYRPFKSHEKSLKKLFSDQKIPREERHQLPVLCDSKGRILWVPGFPPADFAQVRGEFAQKFTFSST